jgi:hypothetical protein
VVNVSLDGSFTARNWRTPNENVPSSYFSVIGSSLVGAPVDGTWALRLSYNLGGGAAGFAAIVGNKTFDAVSNGETCLGVLATTDSEPIGAGGSGYYAADPVSFVKLWNWHKQVSPRYDASCTRPFLGATTHEESPTDARFFASGGP